MSVVLSFKKRSSSLGQHKRLENVFYWQNPEFDALEQKSHERFWEYLKNSTEWYSGVWKDCHRFDVFRKNRCLYVVFSCPSCPCGTQLQMKMAKMDVMYEIRSHLSALVVIKHHLANRPFDTPFDVTSNPVTCAVYQHYLVFTWLQIAFLSRMLHVTGRMSGLSLHDKAHISSHSHFHMISCDVKQ